MPAVPSDPAADHVRILSLDGGGIYQLTAAMGLAELERRTGRRIADLFDLVAGTSAGGLLGLAALVPDAHGRPRYTADELISLYEEDAGRIFASSIWHWLRALGGLIDEKYEATGVEGALDEVFGDVALADAIRPAMIPVYDIDHDTPYFFRSHRARQAPAHAFQMRDALRAATAAPAFFPPGRATSDAGTVLSCIDGGVVAFNPALWAYLEAGELFPNATRVTVASFGAVRTNHGLTYDKVLGWGRVNWAGPVFELMCDVSAMGVDVQLARLLAQNGGDNHCHRFDAIIRRPRFATLDDISDANVQTVKDAGRDMLARNTDRLDTLCAQLV
jgi:patatin-like phospholipase/acyl hydrolase